MFGSARSAMVRMRRWVAGAPPATRGSSFLAGVSFAVLLMLLDSARLHGVLPPVTESRPLFVLLLVFYFATVLVFVIDVRLLTPQVLKTKIPLIYFPTNRDGFRLIGRRWARYGCWLLGATCADLLRLVINWSAH